MHTQKLFKLILSSLVIALLPGCQAKLAGDSTAPTVYSDAVVDQSSKSDGFDVDAQLTKRDGNFTLQIGPDFFSILNIDAIPVEVSDQLKTTDPLDVKAAGNFEGASAVRLSSISIR